MRTTLDLDDDLLQAARDLARRRGMTLGQVISDLARRSLQPKAAPNVRNGVPLFVAKRARKDPDLHLVNQIRDES